MPPVIPLSRRRFLVGGFAATCLSLPVRAQAPQQTPLILHARPGTAALHGEARPPTAIWGYEGAVPGPLLRVKRGEELRVRLVNELPEPTAIHWYGVRLPNPMDGVPDLTQPAVPPGGSFEYRFR